MSLGCDEVNAFQLACDLMPDKLGNALSAYPEAEEVRLRNGHMPSVVLAGHEIPFYNQGVSTRDLSMILERATGASMHSAAPALRNGFIPYRGLRIGICGEVIWDRDGVKGFRSFSSLNVRIPHEIQALDGSVKERFLSGASENTLIIAPPGAGKTSCLRLLIRLASGQERRVAVIDDRNEISATVGGISQFDLGPHSDVLLGADKLTASMFLLRGMNPQVIAMDEISSPSDMEAVNTVIGCGVCLYATAHGQDLHDMKKRKIYQRLLNQGIFKNIITISISNGKRFYSMEQIRA